MMDEDLLQKLRKIQAKEITKSNQTISISKVINETLSKQIKK